MQARLDRYFRTDRPLATQQRALLRGMLRRNADTAFGREHGFSGIASVDAYRRRVPIRDWQSLSPYAARAVAGEPAVLTREPPIFFNRTTGTSGTPKMIPYTARCERLAVRSHGAWIAAMRRDNPALLEGRVLALLNAKVDGHTALGVPYGTVSGGAYARLPAVVRRRYAHPYDLYTIADAAARRYALLRLAIAQPVSLVFTGNPSSLLSLFELGEQQAEALIRDVHDGTLTRALAIDDAVRTAAAPYLAADPARARALADARARSGRFRPADYWPHLRVVSCWLGGSLGHFADQVREWCSPDVRFRDIGYMSSEGVFSIPLADETADAALATNGVFFEFVPEAAFGTADAPTVLAHELEAGRHYHVVITTSGGLYRYAMNDVVRAAGFDGDRPLVRFLYKGGHVKNLSGEMLSLEHVTGAIRAASDASGASLRHFQVAADFDARRYVLHVEPSEAIGAAPRRTLLARFDDELKHRNENYAIHRDEGLIGAPQLRVMRRGWLDRIVAEQMARSGRDSQIKPEVLVDVVAHAEMVEGDDD